MLFGQSNAEIYKRLSEYVSGHDEAKRALIALLNRSKMRYNQRWGKLMHKDYLLQTSKVLLVGASGTGKTHLVDSLSQIVNFPLLKLDATKLNPTGASGGVKEEDLRKMIVDNAKICFDKSPSVYFSVDGAIDQTVVFIDEIDKLGDSFDSSGKWNDHVQSNFLTMFDNKSEFAGVSFVFAGAFTDITKIKKTGSSIGFTREEKELKHEKTLEERIVDCGLLPEIVGRMTSIVQLDNFTKEEYRSILLERLLIKKQQDLAHFGIFDVDLSDAQVEDIIKIAVGSNQGVRSLQRQLDKIFLDVEFSYEEDKTKKLLTLGE